MFKKGIQSCTKNIFSKNILALRVHIDLLWVLLSLIQGDHFQEQGWLAILTKCSVQVLIPLSGRMFDTFSLLPKV